MPKNFVPRISRERAWGHEAALNAGATLASTGLSAAASVVIARQLGTNGRGVSAALLAVVVLCGTFGTLGLPAASAYATARANPSQRPRVVSAAIAISLPLAAMASFASLVIGVALRPPGASGLAIAVAGAGAGALLFRQVVQQVVLTGIGVGWSALTQVVPSVCVLVAACTLSVTHTLTVTTTVAISTAGSIGGAAIGCLGLTRRCCLSLDGRDAVATAFRTMRPFLGFAATLFFITSLAQVVQRIDIILMEELRGSRDAGLYSVAAQIADVLMVIPAAIGAIVFRRGALSAAGHWRDATRAIATTTLTGCCAALVLGVTASPLVERLVGAEYRESVVPLQILLPGVVLLGVQSVISNYVASRGQARTVLVAWATSAVLGIGLDFVVIPEFGPQGAAAVSSFSYLLVLAMHLSAIRRLRPAVP